MDWLLHTIGFGQSMVLLQHNCVYNTRYYELSNIFYYCKVPGEQDVRHEALHIVASTHIQALMCVKNC